MVKNHLPLKLKSEVTTFAEHGLYVKLEHINNYLNNCGMKLLSDDDEVTLPDCALLPRLFHIVHACHGIKGVKVQDETTNLTGKLK